MEEYQKRQGKGACLWNYIRTGTLIDFDLAKKLDSEGRQSWGWYHAIYGNRGAPTQPLHLPAPPRVVFTSLFGCEFFTFTMDDKIMGGK
jgi:hypothetical protein